MREVVIAGIGQTPVGELWDVSLRSLAYRAIRDARADAAFLREIISSQPMGLTHDAELVLWDSRLLMQKGAAAQHRKLRGSGGGGVVRSLVFQDRGRV